MYKLYFDGGADPNPGKAGAGAVIYEKNEEILSVSIYVGDHETNNVAEYTGLIAGLELALENNICDITVKGDSQLVIKQMNEEYKVKSEKLKELYAKAKELTYKFAKIKFIHINRCYNKRADELATLGKTKNILAPTPAPAPMGPICNMFCAR